LSRGLQNEISLLFDHVKTDGYRALALTAWCVCRERQAVMDDKPLLPQGDTAIVDVAAEQKSEPAKPVELSKRGLICSMVTLLLSIPALIGA
jgi:hypothetical protein